jgi:release factor glutamine methyltransferase
MKSVKEYLTEFTGKQREAEIILAHILKTDRANIIAHPELRLTFFQSFKLLRAKHALKNNVPLAYILGQKEFFGLNFFVDKNVLIPRPETEMLVSLALDKSKQTTDNSKQMLIIDIGTGSGCVPIAIMKTLKQENIKTIATDISRPALRAAKKNAKRHGVDIKFLHGDLFQPILKLPITNYQLLITANLPYLTREWTESEPSIAREPKLALIADDKNGLSLYEKLFKQINAFNSTGQPILILCEIDPRQTTDARNLAVKYFPNAQIEIKKDLAGRGRILKIELI